MLNLLAHQCYERQELAEQENTVLASALCSNLLSRSAPQFRSISGVHRQWMGNRSCCWGSQLGAVCSVAFVFAWDWLHPVCSMEKESLLVTKPRALDQLLLCRESKAFGAFILSPTFTGMVGGTSWQDKKRAYLPACTAPRSPLHTGTDGSKSSSFEYPSGYFFLQKNLKLYLVLF